MLFVHFPEFRGCPYHRGFENVIDQGHVVRPLYRGCPYFRRLEVSLYTY